MCASIPSSASARSCGSTCRAPMPRRSPRRAVADGAAELPHGHGDHPAGRGRSAGARPYRAAARRARLSRGRRRERRRGPRRASEEGCVPDLLFTDMVMPGGMNGRELAEHLRRRWPACKVLYTSGYRPRRARRSTGEAVPAKYMLGKPYPAARPRHQGARGARRAGAAGGRWPLSSTWPRRLDSPPRPQSTPHT